MIVAKRFETFRYYCLMCVYAWSGLTVTLESPQAVYCWQRGRNLPSVDNLYAISKLWGVSMNDILVEKAG